jgi:hypothetical protein
LSIPFLLDVPFLLDEKPAVVLAGLTGRPFGKVGE